MPGTQQILYYTSIALQYFFLGLLYIFLYRIVKLIFISVKNVDNLSFIHGKLIVHSHGDIFAKGQEFIISESSVIGRSKDCDIVVNDSSVSYEHACITYAHGDFFITDLKSTNGTYVNDRLIERDVLLKNGDKIKIGKVVFKFTR